MSTITVKTAGGDYSDVQSAINASANGDIIVVYAGTYTLSADITFGGKTIVVKGEDPDTWATVDTVIINGDATYKINFKGGEGRGTVLEGIKITNCTTGILIDTATGSPTIRKCHITANSGSGIKLSGAFAHYPLIRACKIDTNNMGVEVDNDAQEFYLINCLITDNKIHGVYASANSVAGYTANCTIANNHGNGLYGFDHPVLKNCIIWGNYGFGADGDPSSVYSIVQDIILSGSGNLCDDPLFTGASDYTLQAGSPALNAASDRSGDATYAFDDDINGTTRPQKWAWDMGCYESASAPDNDEPPMTITWDVEFC